MVTLTWNEGTRSASQIVNMEEIWTGGTVLECEETVPVDVPAHVEWGGVRFAGRISEAEQHEFGWRVEMEFSPLNPWSPELAAPSHLLEI